MRDGDARLRAALAGFREVGLDEGAVFSAELRVGIERLANARALRPARSGPGGEGHHGDRTFRKLGLPEGDGFRRRRCAGEVGVVLGKDVGDFRDRGQTVPRETDAVGEEVAADGLVLLGIEAPLFQQLGERAGLRGTAAARGDEGFQKIGKGALEIGIAAGKRGEAGELRALGGREIAGLGAEQRGEVELVVIGRQGGVRAIEQGGEGAVRIDGEIIDHRLHREGQRVAEHGFRFRHDGEHARLRFGLARWIENESHAAARHPAEHPEAPEILAELLLRAGDEGFRVEVRGPGDDGLQRAAEIFRGELS